MTKFGGPWDQPSKSLAKALARVERLFCRNERAVLRARLTNGGQPIALVPVAAILVASIRLHFLDVLLHLRYRGANEMPCSASCI